jgi:hypothetical protein
MRIRLSELRKLVAEEVDRLVRNSAGFGGIAGIAGRGRGSAELPPLGLGDEEEQEKERYGKEQEEEQFATRVEKRRIEREGR